MGDAAERIRRRHNELVAEVVASVPESEDRTRAIERIAEALHIILGALHG